ncbi:AEC family transporter [Pseudoalteromonas sp. T1lg65]|uniref:AEC family transporter n=1 Tax=Pseudoalteromonas sp. T1lg65 TaxID=2077101 RepID=UPI003F78E403
MLAIETLLPLIFIVTCGFISAKSRFIPVSQLDGIRTFIFTLCIPLMLFTSMYKADLSQMAAGRILLSFYLPVAGCFLVITLISKYLFNTSMKAAATNALAGTYSNTVLVGLPVILVTLGEHAATMVFMIITLHSAMLFLLTFMLASTKVNFYSTLKPLFLNPIVVSISLGLLFNIMDVTLPEILTRSLSWLAQPAIPGALFVLGASLVSYPVKGHWRQASLLSAIKLIILPCFVYLTATLLLVPERETQVITLMSASPLGVNAYLVARQLNSQQAVLAATVVLSTLMSMFSLSIWLHLLL